MMPAGRITALQAQARDSTRVNVFIDGTFALGISLDTLARTGLYVGKALSAEEWVSLEASESGDKAFHAALQLLAVRPRSEHEIRSRLATRGFAPEAAAAALDRLRNLGLVDDLAFARLLVESRLAQRPRGTAALREELNRKGVDRNLAQQVLAEGDIAADEAGRAEQVARAVLRRYSATDRPTFQRRLGGYLQRRGFGYETIAPILDRLWNEIHQSSRED